MLTKIESSIKKLATNKNIRYILTKYLTYLIQFISSILIANAFGLYLFGIYSYFKLLLQYFSYSNLGVNYSFLVYGSYSKDDDNKISKYFSSSLLVTLFTSIILTYFFYKISCYLGSDNFIKYDIDSFYSYFVLILILKLINQLYINLYRIYDKLKFINFSYLLPALTELLLVILLKKSTLLFDIFFCGMIFSQLLVLIIFFLSSPIKFPYLTDKIHLIIILKRGLKLLLYNASFYFISIIGKTIISTNYEISDFSNYSFAYNITEAIFLLTGSIGFLIYPKILFKLKTKSVDESIKYIGQINKKYMVLSSVICSLSIVSFPYFVHFFPDYNLSEAFIDVLIIHQLLIANTFGITTLLVHKNHDVYLIIVGIISIILLIAISSMVIKFIGAGKILVWVPIIPLLLYNIFAFHKVELLSHVQKNKFWKSTINFLVDNYSYYTPFIFFYLFKYKVSEIVSCENLSPLILFVSFIVFNYKIIRESIREYKILV